MKHRAVYTPVAVHPYFFTISFNESFLGGLEEYILLKIAEGLRFNILMAFIAGNMMDKLNPNLVRCPTKIE